MVKNFINHHLILIPVWLKKGFLVRIIIYLFVLVTNIFLDEVRDIIDVFLGQEPYSMDVQVCEISFIYVKRLEC